MQRTRIGVPGMHETRPVLGGHFVLDAPSSKLHKLFVPSRPQDLSLRGAQCGAVGMREAQLTKARGDPHPKLSDFQPGHGRQGSKS